MNLFKNKENIRPMLLKQTTKPFNDKNYIYEMKYDGERALIYVDKKKITIINRKGNILNDTYPELLDIKNIVINHKVIFDGEITLFENNIPSFFKLQERLHLKDKKKIDFFVKNHPVTFVCFDILYDKKDLTNLSLLERKKHLNNYKNTNIFIKTKYIEEFGKELFKIIKRENLEGIVAKEKNSKYLINTRSNNWIKIKNIQDEEYYICGYLESSKSNVASLILGEKTKKGFKFVSKVFIGRKKLDYSKIKTCKKGKNKLIDFNDKNYIYLEPKLKCTVSFTQKTKNGHLRHPVYKSLKY